MRKVLSAILIILALGISACGGDDEKQGANPPPAGPQQTQPNYGGNDEGCYEYQYNCDSTYCDSGWVDVPSDSCGY